jgi:hypothetical protein
LKDVEMSDLIVMGWVSIKVLGIQVGLMLAEKVIGGK